MNKMVNIRQVHFLLSSTNPVFFFLKFIPLLLVTFNHFACATNPDNKVSKLNFNELETRMAKQFKDFRQSDMGMYRQHVKLWTFSSGIFICKVWVKEVLQ